MGVLGRLLPSPLVEAAHALNAKVFATTLRHMRKDKLQAALRANDYNVCKLSDFYAPLPDVERLAETRARWDRPSDMPGVVYDLDGIQGHLKHLFDTYGAELAGLPDDAEVSAQGFGPGFPTLDGYCLYLMLRELKPARFLEIGSGKSTVYASFTAEANEKDGRPMARQSIDPFPTDALKALGVDIVCDEVQNVPLATFEALQAGDVLFIDSTHMLKVDSDVTFLYLEVLPRLAPGVVVHIHDVQFPFNAPHPAEKFIFDFAETRWPMFWNEAMLVQAMLAFGDRFDIVLSTPLIRHYDEAILREVVPGYVGMDLADFKTFFSSLWLRRSG
jgi:hypothetical protein